MTIITTDLKTSVDRMERAASHAVYAEALRDVLLAITPGDSFEVILDKIRTLSNERERIAKEGK